VYAFQIIYYTLAAIVLALGISIITSTLVVFLKDVAQFVAMIVQIGFWLTPIFYSLDMIPDKYHAVYRFNPVMYITEGYRDSFIHKRWFWQDSGETILFWIISLGILCFAVLIYKKLRPHFTDVI
jgi:ABC-type polysaccharide/polyol phosphate export permease